MAAAHPHNPGIHLHVLAGRHRRQVRDADIQRHPALLTDCHQRCWPHRVHKRRGAAPMKGLVPIPHAVVYGHRCLDPAGRRPDIPQILECSVVEAALCVNQRL